jgi:hypothetical protein
MRAAFRLGLIVAALSPAIALAGPKTHGPGGGPHLRPEAPPHAAGHSGPRSYRPTSPHRHRDGLRRWPVYGVPYAYPVPVIVAAPPPPPAPRPVQPLSFNIADPSAVAIRLPSGRVAVRSAGGYWQRGHAAAQPYAPPVIHIIGQASGQHMRGPVHLVHGVQPPKRLATSPQVIWLKQPSGGRGPLKPAE